MRTENRLKAASLLFKFVDFVNDRKVNNVVRTIEEIANAAVTLSEKKSVLSLAWFAAKVAVSLSDSLEIDEYMFFENGGDWTPILTSDFTSLVESCTSHLPSHELRTTSRGTFVHLVEISPGITIGWMKTRRGDDSLSQQERSMWVKSDRYEETMSELTKILWKKFSDRPIFIESSDNSFDPGKKNERFSFSVDDSWTYKTSKTTKKYGTYIKRCIDADVARAILFFGPPGTGKSTMVQAIVKDLGLRSMRISVQDIAMFKSKTLYHLIKIFRPDCVVIDDIDRMIDSTAMLDILQFFKKEVRLVMATANKRSQMDEAILRPGRFDELVPVTELDDDVIRNVLGKEHEKSFELVKKWPIAYIEEFKIRRQFMSEEEAASSTVELQSRVSRLKTYYDETADSKEKDDQDDDV